MAKDNTLLYAPEDNPPVQITIFFVLQVMLSIMSSPLAAAFIIYNNLCAQDNPEVLAQLISTTLLMVGLATFLQVTFGLRLPVVQCSSFIFIPAIVATMQSQRWACPTANATQEGTSPFPIEQLDADELKPWIPRILELSGTLAVASCVHMLLGLTGLVGLLTRFIGPLTTAPTIALIPIGLLGAVANNAKHNWWIMLFTMSLAMFFSMFLGNIGVPMPTCNKTKGCHVTRIRLFRILANIFAIIGGWLLCYILTEAGVFTDDPDAIGYLARTDAKLKAIEQTSWLHLPYPGYWGMPTLSAASLIGFIPAVMGSVIESVGDYYATARVCQKPPPPSHAINRGIFVEGVASLISGLLGACHATTSYSEIAGYISYTGMSSRIVWQVTGVFFFVCGISGKLGGALAIMPEPVVGGMMMIGLSMVFSVAIGGLRSVDMAAPRNQMVLGISMLMGILIPMYLREDPTFVFTGHSELDQVVSVLLANGPVIGGVTGCLLDNILPGDRRSRGMTRSESVDEDDVTKTAQEDLVSDPVYEIAFTKCIPRNRWFGVVPILPCFTGYSDCGCRCCCKGGGDQTDNITTLAITNLDNKKTSDGEENNGFSDMAKSTSH